MQHDDHLQHRRIPTDRSFRRTQHREHLRNQRRHRCEHAYRHVRQRNHPRQWPRSDVNQQRRLRSGTELHDCRRDRPTDLYLPAERHRPGPNRSSQHGCEPGHGRGQSADRRLLLRWVPDDLGRLEHCRLRLQPRRHPGRVGPGGEYQPRSVALPGPLHRRPRVRRHRQHVSRRRDPEHDGREHRSDPSRQRAVPDELGSACVVHAHNPRDEHDERRWVLQRHRVRSQRNALRAVRDQRLRRAPCDRRHRLPGPDQPEHRRRGYVDTSDRDPNRQQHSHRPRRLQPSRDIARAKESAQRPLRRRRPVHDDGHRGRDHHRQHRYHCRHCHRNSTPNSRHPARDPGHHLHDH